MLERWNTGKAGEMSEQSASRPRGASESEAAFHTNRGLTAHDLALVDAVAKRVLDLLDQRETFSGLVDAGTLARLLGVSRSTVYDNAAKLGAIEIGDGSRPRLRFDVEKARNAWTARSCSERSQPVVAEVRRRKRVRLGTSVDLLPVKGSEAA